MIKRIPSRNPRSKGVRVKHVLQICLLLGVCFWLIYQVKRSHDKKREFDENEVKDTINGDGTLKFGRKDLNPRVPAVFKNAKHEDDEDDDVGTGEEMHKEDENKLEQELEEAEMKHREEEEEEEDFDGESKLRIKETEEGTVHKEEEREQESKTEEDEEEEEEQEEVSKREQMKDDDDTGGGDDDMDEHDQDKIEEADRDEEPVDEDKEVQEGEEKVVDAAEGEGKVHTSHETEGKDQDLDGGDQHAHEAREEIYRADDASSAVTHDTRILSTEPEHLSQDHSKKNSAITDSETRANITTNDSKSGNGGHDQGASMLEQLSSSGNGQPLNTMPADDEKLLANSGDRLETGNTSEVDAEGSSKLKGDNTGTSDTSQHNEAKTILESQAHDATVDRSSIAENTKLNTSVLEQESNKTGTEQPNPDEGSSSSSTHSETDASRMNIKPEVTAGGEEGLGSSSANDTGDATHSDDRKNTSDNTEDAAHSDKREKTGVKATDAVVSDKPENTSDNTADATHSDNHENTSESGGTDENHVDSNADSKGENEEIHDPEDSSDSAISRDEKENRLDLDTLPENSSDGVNDRNTATE